MSLAIGVIVVVVATCMSLVLLSLVVDSDDVAPELLLAVWSLFDGRFGSRTALAQASAKLASWASTLHAALIFVRGQSDRRGLGGVPCVGLAFSTILGAP